MNSATLLDLAVKQHQAGNLRAAEQLYRQILNVEPRHGDALHLLGVIAHQVGRNDLALAYIGQALREKPNHAAALGNLGAVLVALGRLDEAATAFRQAVFHKPDYAEAHNNLGNVLRQQEKLAEAAASYEQALRIRPDLPEALNSLGGILKMQGKLSDAVARWERAIALKPDHAAAHNNLGTARLEQGRLAEALAHFERALLREPDNVDYHFNRALLWLLQGNFAQGWTEYEWRWRRPSQPPRPFAQPLWQGEPLAGRTLLLHAEQGLGDTLQMVRYLAMVRARSAGKVVLEVQPPLVRLLTHALGALVDRILPQGEPLPAFDLHAPLFSLPRLLGTTSLERIPCNIPYLHCDQNHERHWQARLDGVAAVRGLRVGIVWQGNPENKEDRRRSVPLAQFGPLLQVPGVTLISLQKGPGREQLADLPGLVDLGSELADLADTAAVLKHLDLVVTVDTAVAHLAGALGVVAWVALPFLPDWRWRLEGTDSPWYSSLRLFRQSRPGEWDEVFERVALAVRERL